MSEFVFECIDGHTCGNPVRVITTGHPKLQGETMSAKRQHFLKEFDWIRKGLMFEPRGHDMMSGCFFFDSQHSENDIAILFLETSGCLPMCGHGTIGAITIGIEKALIKPKIKGEVRLETPAGLVIVNYQEKEGRVDWVKIRNVVSYLAEENLSVNCAKLGELRFDVAYGGNFYAIIDPQPCFAGVEHFSASELIQISKEVRVLINEKYGNTFIHPENPTIKTVSHIQWTGTPLSSNSSGRNAVFYGDKAIDRSPCGTGTSARMAQLHAKGKLKKGATFIHESYIGSIFEGSIEEEIQFYGKKAIVPSIKGWARIFGKNTITIDTENDPYAYGFQVI